MLRIELIVNSHAGRGRGRAAADAARRVLEAAGCEVLVQLPATADAARDAAGDASMRADVVVAVGGDGTLRTVLEGLRRPVSTGVIPLGTANVVARELRIPLEPRKAAAVIVGGRTQSMDLGEANGRRFLAMAGVGLDAEIIDALHAERRGPIRKSDYLAPTWRALTAPARARLRLSIDGSPFGPMLQDVIVCNVRNYAAYFAVAPAAVANDGRLDWVARPPSGAWSSLRWAWAAIRRRPAAGLYYGQGESLTIEATGDPVAVHLDGDSAGTTPLTVRILPAAAKLCVP